MKISDERAIVFGAWIAAKTLSPHCKQNDMKSPCKAPIYLLEYQHILQQKESGFAMKKKTLWIVGIAVALVLVVGGLIAYSMRTTCRLTFSPSTTTPAVSLTTEPKTSAPTTTAQPTDPPPVTDPLPTAFVDTAAYGSLPKDFAQIKDNVTWVVEPRLLYDEIVYAQIFCAWYNNESRNYKLSPQDIIAGKNKVVEIAPPGYDAPWMAYDRTTKQWGVSGVPSFICDSLKKAMERSGNTKHVLFPVTSVTFGKAAVDGEVELEDHRKYAWATAKGLLTNFIYDDFDRYYFDGTPAVKQGDKWGFVDNSGKTVIPFLFDGAVSIDATHAFVQWGGRWGVIKKVA